MCPITWRLKYNEYRNKACVFDFVTSGYNYIDAEVAVFSISLLFIDLYYSPKYHRESYCGHEKICDMIPNIPLDFLREKIY